MTEGCWIWEATLRKREGKNRNIKYGSFQIDGVNYLAHRISFFVHKYETDLCVLHECDNGLCVNPAHLSEGTRADNNRQMAERGRNARANRILTEAQATYALLCRGVMTAKAVAEELGVARPTIESIWQGRSWRHLQS